MEALFAIIVIGSILIAIAGCALYLFRDLHKQSLLKISDEQAFIVCRQQAISQREQEEKLALAMEARKEAIAARRVRRAARTTAQQTPLESQKESITSGAPKTSIVSD